MPISAIATALEEPSATPVSESLLRGTILVGAIQVASAALRYGSALLFARWLGVSDYGNYAYAIALSQVLAIFGTLGLPSGVMRFVPEYVARRDWPRLRGLTLRARQLSAATGIAIALLATGGLMIVRPGHLSLAALLAGVWLTPLIGLSELESQISRALHRLGTSYSLPMLADPFLSVALVFVLWRQAGYLTVALVMIVRCISLALTVGVQLAGSQAAMPREARDCAPVSEIPQWLNVSFHMLLVGSYTIIMYRTDVLILGLFRPAREVGIYSAAATTAGAVGLVLVAALAKAAPMMSAMFAGGDRSGLERVVHTVTLWSFWPAVAVALAMWGGGDRILALFGPGFSAGYWALAILVLGQVVNCGAGPVAALASVTGHHAEAARVFGWSTLGNVVLCLMLVPPFGLLGAAFASAATLAILNARLYRVVTRNLGIRPLGALKSQLISAAGQLSSREV